MVKSRMLDDSLGYIQITEFTDGTSEQFKKAYSELNEQGMKGLLVDLRENPGGLLTAVCDTLEQILPKGMIVYTEDKSGHRTGTPVKEKHRSIFRWWFWSMKQCQGGSRDLFRGCQRS